MTANPALFDYTEVLSKLGVKLQQENRPLLPGCSSHELDRLRQQFYQAFLAPIPESYCRFLGRVNGFSRNGVTLFGYDAAMGATDCAIDLFNKNKNYGSEYPYPWGNRPRVILGISEKSLYTYSPGTADFFITNLNTGARAWQRPSDRFFQHAICEALDIPLPTLLSFGQVMTLNPAAKSHSPSISQAMCADREKFIESRQEAFWNHFRAGKFPEMTADQASQRAAEIEIEAAREWAAVLAA